MLASNPSGVLVTGAQSRCGKTVACAGLAGVLHELGFKAQAIKPLSFVPKVTIRASYEQAYFERIMPPIEPVEIMTAESPLSLGSRDWQRLVETTRRRAYPYLLETPGSLASPIRFIQDEVLDAVDLAQALEASLLIVTPKQPDIVAALAPIFAYLWHRNAQVVGWLAVETTPMQTPYWDTEVLYLGHHYRFPYLGEIAYSPSISVEAGQQGNLIRTTELGVDLLPLQQALNLLVP